MNNRKRRWLLFVVIPVALAALYFLALPALTPDWIRGSLVDAVVIPEAAADGARVWLLTDGGYHFRYEVETANSSSNSPACFFCKAWLYVYDPVAKVVQKRFLLEEPGVYLRRHVVLAGGKVW